MDVLFHIDLEAFYEAVEQDLLTLTVDAFYEGFSVL